MNCGHAAMAKGWESAQLFVASPQRPPFRLPELQRLDDAPGWLPAPFMLAK
jgi:hypothetical protein